MLFVKSGFIFCYFGIISGPSFEEIWIPITQGFFVSSSVEIGPVVLEKKICSNFVNVFSLNFGIISPWKRTLTFFWTNLNFPHPKMLCVKFGWNCSSGSGWENENVKSLRQLMRQRQQLLIRKAHLSLSSGELKILHLLPRMLGAKFGWNWPSGSGEQDDNVKVYDSNDNNDDRKWKSSLEFLAQVS